MREQDLNEEAIFAQFTERRTRQIKEIGIKFQYFQSQYQLLRTGYFSFSKALDKLKDLRDQKKCLAIYSTRGTWISNVQPFDIRIRDENGLIAIESNELQSKLTNGYSYFLTIFRIASDIGFRLALSMELSRFVARDYNCQVLDFIKGRIHQLAMDQIQEFKCQGLANYYQKKIIKQATRNRIMIIEGAAGVGKSLVGTIIATKFAEIGKKVLLTGVKKQASKAISEHMTNQISLYHDHLLHYQFLKYIKAIVKVRTMIKNPKKQDEIINILDRQIKTIVKRIIKEKISFLYFNLLITIEQYFTLQPFLRFYTFNTQLIINLLRVTQFNTNVLDIIIALNKIANIKFVDATWKKHYQQAVRMTFSNADIISTHTALVGEINKIQRQGQLFQPYLAIFDEAGQATLENAYSIFKLGVNNLILIGDEKQFKPRTTFQQVVKKTLFTILRDNKEVNIFRLTDQFRMNKEINDLVSYVSYQQGEINYQDMGEKHISYKDFFCEYPLFMITHSFLQQIPPEHEGNGYGYFNEAEIKMIRLYVDQIESHQLKNVGIVTFYRPQVKRLKKEFPKEVKLGLSISTVEGYQGASKDHILFSVVRSNKRGALGEARNRNGINVALSRARKGLIIFGNTNTLLRAGYYDNPWYKVIGYLASKGRVYQFNDELTQLADQASKNKLQRDTTQQFDFGQQFDEEGNDDSEYNDLIEARAIFGEDYNETVELPFIQRNNY